MKYLYSRYDGVCELCAQYITEQNITPLSARSHSISRDQNSSTSYLGCSIRISNLDASEPLTRYICPSVTGKNLEKNSWKKYI